MVDKCVFGCICFQKLLPLHVWLYCYCAKTNYFDVQFQLLLLYRLFFEKAWGRVFLLRSFQLITVKRFGKIWSFTPLHAREVYFSFTIQHAFSLRNNYFNVTFLHHVLPFIHFCLLLIHLWQGGDAAVHPATLQRNLFSAACIQDLALLVMSHIL